MSKKLTGAEMITEALKEEGVETIFGYPGGAVIPIYDQLYDEDFEHILAHHEQGAAHAADGYARATGKVGVCIATSGPGATNLTTGLANAKMDSVPMVAFTGQVPSHMLGSDAFQEADVTGITMPITKHNYLVQDAEELPRIIKEAFHIARTGRPGPVVIDVPKDMMQMEGEYDYPDQVNLRGYKPNYEGHEGQVKSAAEKINEAKRPIIYAGGGVIISEASQELRKLARKSQIPVTTTLTGLGAFDEQDELSLGMLGMHGTSEANLTVSNADLIIAVGCRFDDRVTGKLNEFAPDVETIVHIDIDPGEIGKRVAVNIPIVGDAKNVLQKLTPRIEEKERDGWLERIEQWKEIDRANIQYAKENGTIAPHLVMEEIYELTGGDAYIVTEVGQHQMWAAQHFKYSHPGQFITSGGLGTMGYGLPAGIGAQAGQRDDDVYVIAGDGSLQMNIQELATAVKNDLPVNVIIMNNTFLGMVRQWQEIFADSRYSETCLKERDYCPDECEGPGDEECPEMVPNFVKLADAYDVEATRVLNLDDYREALAQAHQSRKMNIIEVMIGEEENVFPMVPPGGSLYEMIYEEGS
ncbi:biosynthetic-type acetolactate synthase large subunit [Halarsenatibacter silvermanii]|uniref:Acetolactate synthase n=1 Tax=Halarsenatibacter silvermanii TaxID=321763 RepID=A0A1G9QTV8_9FIRM|nr:biosynthetic-type acetolactate synthase large subunit [Halarsenatibacter silvermanii]SDM14027.1 acetolactate synthase, large subunit [Halarsenatibacter silvermanii]